MNDSFHENPGPAMTAAAAIGCPQCGTQLRLLRPATMHTEIACCICGATFYMQPIETAPMSEAVVSPQRAFGVVRPVLRATPPSTRPSDRGARLPADPPAAMTTPAPPAPMPGT